MENSLLTCITFLPLLGAAFILAVPGSAHSLIRGISVIVSGLVFLLTLQLYFVFDPNATAEALKYGAYDAKTFVEIPWISSYHIYFRLGVDGLSVMLILLTGLLSFLATFTAFTIKKHVKGFYALF